MVRKDACSAVIATGHSSNLGYRAAVSCGTQGWGQRTGRRGQGGSCSAARPSG